MGGRGARCLKGHQGCECLQDKLFRSIAATRLRLCFAFRRCACREPSLRSQAGFRRTVAVRKSRVASALRVGPSAILRGPRPHSRRESRLRDRRTELRNSDLLYHHAGARNDRPDAHTSADGSMAITSTVLSPVPAKHGTVNAEHPLVMEFRRIPLLPYSTPFASALCPRSHPFPSSYPKRGQVGCWLRLPRYMFGRNNLCY